MSRAANRYPDLVIKFVRAFLGPMMRVGVSDLSSATAAPRRADYNRDGLGPAGKRKLQELDRGKSC